MPKRNPETEARRSELIVLFMLMELERSGYQIRQLIKEWRIDRYLPMSPTTIYRALERLAAEGCLTCREKRNGRYPASTIYAITEQGKARYHDLRQMQSVFSRTTHAADVFLGFWAYLTPRERIDLAREWQAAARIRIEELDARIDDKNLEPGHTYGKPFAEWLLLDHERDLLKAEVAWFDKFIDFIVTGQA